MTESAHSREIQSSCCSRGGCEQSTRGLEALRGSGKPEHIALAKNFVAVRFNNFRATRYCDRRCTGNRAQIDGCESFPDRHCASPEPNRRNDPEPRDLPTII